MAKQNNTNKLLLAALLFGGVYAATRPKANTTQTNTNTGGGKSWQDVLNSILNLGKDIVDKLPDKKENNTGSDVGDDNTWFGTNSPTTVTRSATGQPTVYFADPKPAASVYLPAANSGSVIYALPGTNTKPSAYFPSVNGIGCACDEDKIKDAIERKIALLMSIGNSRKEAERITKRAIKYILEGKKSIHDLLD
ncbi:MAG: hypothetical protein ACXWW0_00075 [Bacteroidia bacterium]